MESMIFGLSLVFLFVWTMLMWAVGFCIHRLARVKLSYRKGGLFDQRSSALLLIWYVVSALPVIAGVLVKPENSSPNGNLNAESMHFMIMTADPVFLGSTAAFLLLSGVCIHLIDHHLLNLSTSHK